MAKNIDGKRMYTKEEMRSVIYSILTSSFTDAKNIIYHVVAHDMTDAVNTHGIRLHGSFYLDDNSNIKVWQDGFEELAATVPFKESADIDVIFEMLDLGTNSTPMFSLQKERNYYKPRNN